jgi:hypothetical protein
MMSKVEDEVCEEIQERAKVGLKKYGVTMERDDLTHDEWLEHLQHELMDAIVYVQRLRTREQTLEAKLKDYIATKCDSITTQMELEALLDWSVSSYKPSLNEVSE